MKQSKLFTKTSKEVSKDEVSINSQLLLRGGFIDKTMAGVYSFLPLGLRVLNKINNIIREEMDALGSQEMLMSALSPKQLWEQTGRLDTVDVLFEASGANTASQKKNSASYILNSTHEELVTPIAKKHCPSYKDLPFSVYQIQAKFRNEARAKSGIMRGREFLMKDLYSFHRDEQDLISFYEESKVAYNKVFTRVGVGESTVIALAAGGDFTKDYTHEFQTFCEAGEDEIFYSRKLDTYFNREVAPSQAPRIENDETELEKQEVFGEGIVGVEELSKFLKIPVERTTKTLIYETDGGELIAAVVRGDYEIDEDKLLAVLGTKDVQLASEEVLKRVTGAEVGYAGVLNLSKEVKVFMDESVAHRKNFEMGANKTNYHTVNVNFGRDLDLPEKFYDFKITKEGDFHPETGEVYEVGKASEVGNIFKLNTKFSKSCDYYYSDEEGNKQLVYMGCYGIGPSRLMGVVVEKFNDKRGIIWPDAIAPYQVHLISLKQNEETEKLYNELLVAGIEVLFDDRDNMPGEKFADSDLIGCPIRLVVSAKTLKEDSVEYKRRDSEEIELVKLSEILNKISNL